MAHAQFAEGLHFSAFNWSQCSFYVVGATCHFSQDAEEAGFWLCIWAGCAPPCRNGRCWHHTICHSDCSALALRFPQAASLASFCVRLLIGRADRLDPPNFRSLALLSADSMLCTTSWTGFIVRLALLHSSPHKRNGLAMPVPKTLRSHTRC